MTPSPERLLDLAARCEALEPDWNAIAQLNEDIHAITSDPKLVIPPDYCRSLDAAMQLVPTLCGVELGRYSPDEDICWVCEISTETADGKSRAATKELAFIAAALRSLAEEGEK